MAIKLNPTRSRRLGERGFEVEWCDLLPMIEGTNPPEADMDKARWRRKLFKTKDEAIAFAKQVLPEDKFGSVRVTPVEWQDPIGENLWPTFCWEYIGDSIEISDP